MLVKLEWLGCRAVINNDDMLSRFHLIPERYGQTNRRTDRFATSRVSVLTRDKNGKNIVLCWIPSYVEIPGNEKQFQLQQGRR